MTTSIHTQPIAVIAGGYEAVPLRIAGTNAREGVESSVFAKLDGATTIAEIASACGLTAREVLHLVTGWVLEGKAEIVTASSIRGTSVAFKGPQDFVDFSDVMQELELESSGTEG